MSSLEDDIQDLTNSRSSKRRSAAKRLRKKADRAAGAALLAALTKEIQDKRTRETQYQMVMAIGECGYTEALPVLDDLARTNLEATMLHVAVGDALVRMTHRSIDDGTPIIEMLKTGNASLIDGALRAMAMLRMKPSDDDLGTIIDYAEQFPTDDNSRFWIIAACPGWTGERVEKFIDDCSRSSNNEIAQAAKLAADRKYKKWSPL